MSDMSENKELRGALVNLLDQVYQMTGMFPDKDGATERAIFDAEVALSGSSERNPNAGEGDKQTIMDMIRSSKIMLRPHFENTHEAAGLSIPEFTVCLNGWYQDSEGNQSYADPNFDGYVDGWSVYVRQKTLNDPTGQSFNMIEDEEFDHLGQAEQRARELAVKYDCAIHYY